MGMSALIALELQAAATIRKIKNAATLLKEEIRLGFISGNSSLLSHCIGFIQNENDQVSWNYQPLKQALNSVRQDEFNTQSVISQKKELGGEFWMLDTKTALTYCPMNIIT
jgi:hypothetical protein